MILILLSDLHVSSDIYMYLLFKVVNNLDTSTLNMPRLCIVVYGLYTSVRHLHTGKCIRRFGGIYAYCWYFVDRKW